MAKKQVQPKPVAKKPVEIKATKDSTSAFRDKANIARLKYGLASGLPAMKAYANEENKANQSVQRQKLKGKPGYDANGFKKKK